MRQGELKKCAFCGKGVMHSGCPIFYRVSVERLCVDVGAVQRRHGLELLVGSPAIAAVMGPDEDIAKSVDKADHVICQDCIIERHDLLQLTEAE